MKNNVSNTDVGFQIKAIEILEFSLYGRSNPLPDIFTYHTNINLEHRINEAKRFILVIPSTEVIHEDKTTVLAKIKVSFVYEFNSFESFTRGNSGIIKPPQEIITALNSVSISTLRGIMFSLFRGTFLHKAILPVVDPKSFVLENQP